MSDYVIRYDKMVESALRGVVRETLAQVGRDGLAADHHFYITFDTNFAGVEIPDYLKKRYPSEMTIVLQHQFYGLKIEPEQFSVTLSFNNNPERLVVPFAAIQIFADPSVSFALQFETPYDDEDEDDEAEMMAPPTKLEPAPVAPEKKSKGRGKAAAKDEAGGDDDGKRGEVVSLAAFRKKKSDD